MCGIVLACMSAAQLRTPVCNHRIRLGHLLGTGEHRGDALKGGWHIRWHSKKASPLSTCSDAVAHCMCRRLGLSTRAARFPCPAVSGLLTHQVIYMLRKRSRSEISRSVREPCSIAFMASTNDIPTPHRLAAASTLDKHFRRDSALWQSRLRSGSEFLSSVIQAGHLLCLVRLEVSMFSHKKGSDQSKDGD